MKKLNFKLLKKEQEINKKSECNCYWFNGDLIGKGMIMPKKTEREILKRILMVEK
jgi:hypothetical protein